MSILKKVNPGKLFRQMKAGKALAWLLSFAMVLSMVPAKTVRADEKKLTMVTSGGLEDGAYVFAFESNSYYTALSSNVPANNWLSAVTIDPDSVLLTEELGHLIWTLENTGQTITLQAANGDYLACSGSGNVIFTRSEPYHWQYTYDPEDNTFVLHEDKALESGTYVVAHNSAGPNFRTYRYSTLTGSGSASYNYRFAAFLVEDAPLTKVPLPVAYPVPGSVVAGAEVTLSCPEPGMVIYYTTDGSDPLENGQAYTGPIAIETTTIIKAYGSDPSGVLEDSAPVEFKYTVRDGLSYIIDNILGGDSHGAISIEEAFNVSDGTAGVEVIGQLTYKFGNYNDVNSAIIQDIISGETLGLQLYNSLAGYEIGDIVKITGQKTTYGSVPQIQSITGVELLVPATDVAVIAPQEYTSISALLNDKSQLVSEVVLLNGVTLGEYASDGTTYVTDENNERIGIYRAAAYPDLVTEGEVVNLLAVMSKYNNTDQLRTGPSEYNGGRNIYDVANDVTPPAITMPSAYEPAQTGIDYLVSVSVTDNKGVHAVHISYNIDDAGYTEPEAMALNLSSGKYEYVIPGGLFTDATSFFRYKIEAADVSALTSVETSPKIDIVNLPVVLSVYPTSGMQTGDNKRPAIAVTFENAGENPDVILSVVNTEGTSVVFNEAMAVTENTATYALTRDLADGRYTAKIKITPKEGTALEYSWSFIIGVIDFSAYFGQLHAHTAEYSDGSGTLQQALNYISSIGDADNVQFVAFTDHSNYFDSTSAANPPEALYDIDKMTPASRALWEKYTGDMRAFNEEDHGVLAIPGFEMTWSGGPGHMNTFNSTGLVSRNNATLNNKTNDAGIQAYYNLLKHEENANTISQFNHPGTTFGTFSDFAYWDPGVDEMVSLIEVGNGTGSVKGTSGYFPSYELYTQALDKGWHLAPTNNQDNHSATWGNANTARTVILTDDFTEEGLIEGMRNRTMYATEDKNLEISYYVNNMVMGSIISEVPDSLHIYANIHDPDDEAIGTVEIVVNGGRVIHQETFTENTAVIDFTIDDPAYSYYFLRVVQPDTDIAVTAPVWVGDVIKIGITGVTTETIMPVKGEAMKFETALYNYEEDSMSIEKLEYAITHLGITTVIETHTSLEDIPGRTNAKVFTLDYIPDKLGFITLTVTLEALMNGVPYNFESNIEFEVLDPDNLVNMAIDGGHRNFYVSGNYADSDAGLIEMAARSGIRVVRLGAGELTYENLMDKELLVLTVPFDSFGTAVTQYLYTEDELAAIKQYADNGGNLIICSKSDRGDPAGEGEQAAVITNEILEVIGAKARVASGIVIDEARKSNELFRITLGGDSDYDKLCFNYESMDADELAAIFLKDVEETTNNTFSAYNSAPIIPNGATPLVSGFRNTTWGTLFNDLSSNTALKPGAAEVTAKGDTHLMTVEKLPGGGFAVTAGVTFFSTFEVKVELDYAGQLQNTNYQIVQNILDQVRPEEVITPIAELHKADEGLRFTIEGIATSNASGFDQSTAFFDCIYVQDETGGINVFPISGDIQAGQKLRITGYTSSFETERQLAADIVKITDESIQPVVPQLVTAAAADAGEYLGALIKVQGKVLDFTESNGVVETITVTDESGGQIRVFINGYITSDKVIDHLKKGADITVTGLSSQDYDGYRIRIKDRDDIICTPVGTVVEVESVKINSAAITVIAARNQLQLSATVLPENATDQSITWVSSNPSIATVDENGYVTANKSGMITITATTANGKVSTIILRVTL